MTGFIINKTDINIKKGDTLFLELTTSRDWIVTKVISK